LPTAKLGEQPLDLELHYHYDDLSPVPGAPYKVTFENGAVMQGTLDANGYALLKSVPPGGYTVEYGEDSRDWACPAPPPDDADFAKTEVSNKARPPSRRCWPTSRPLGTPVNPRWRPAHESPRHRKFLQDPAAGGLRGEPKHRPGRWGLIALIPILGQVMAARDVTGSIYAIGVKGASRVPRRCSW
jgi:hypothetical protein